MEEAGLLIESWRQGYNEERPHSSLGYQTPWEYEATWQRTETSEATNY